MEEDMRSLGFQPVSSKNNMRRWNKKTFNDKEE